jgi:uncharacterized protein
VRLIYFDSSALLKSVLIEGDGADRFRDAFSDVVASGATAITSALARVEVGRTLQRSGLGREQEGAALAETFQGLGIAPITTVVIEFARTLEPSGLRSLDAIHLATAVALGAHELWTYDIRLAEAAERAAIPVRSP